MNAANKALHRTSHKVRRPVNADVRTGNGVSMATRACKGDVDTGTRMKPRISTQNPYYSALQASRTAKVC